MTFDELRTAYAEQVDGLIEGGADLLLIETIFDTLNAKAAIAAIADVSEARGVRLPVMISGTITDRSGRLLSGQTPAAFWNSVGHAAPFSIGLNCALGAKEMRAHIAEIARVADTLVCAYPNAGLPNEFGRYDESPEFMAGCSRNLPMRASSTSSAAAAAPRPSTSAPSPQAVAGKAPRKFPRCRRFCACPASKPSRSRRKSRSSMWASAPTSPARPNFASSSPPATTPRRSRSRATRSRTARRSSTSTWTRACSIPRRR